MRPMGTGTSTAPTWASLLKIIVRSAVSCRLPPVRMSIWCADLPLGWISPGRQRYRWRLDTTAGPPERRAGRPRADQSLTGIAEPPDGSRFGSPDDASAAHSGDWLLVDSPERGQLDNVRIVGPVAESSQITGWRGFLGCSARWHAMQMLRYPERALTWD